MKSKRRTLRGGSYYRVTGYLRTANRNWGVPVSRGRVGGFRIVVQRRSP